MKKNAQQTCLMSQEANEIQKEPEKLFIFDILNFFDESAPQYFVLLQI